MNSNFLEDYRANFNEEWKLFSGLGRLLKNYWLRFLFWNRIQENASISIVKALSVMFRDRIGKKYGLEMDFLKGHISGGIVFSHPYNITVNSDARLGKNVVLFKGSTIGSIRSGNRQGTPKIGNHVVIGCNAFVCGGVTIGEDVLIAANAFVNFDVPDHSIVIGNPGIIKSKINATQDYCHYEEWNVDTGE